MSQSSKKLIFNVLEKLIAIGDNHDIYIILMRVSDATNPSDERLNNDLNTFFSRLSSYAHVFITGL